MIKSTSKRRERYFFSTNSEVEESLRLFPSELKLTLVDMS